MYSDLSQMSNNALAERMQAGDEASFEVFYHRWKGYVSYRVSEKVRNFHDAEEITSGILLKIWELSARWTYGDFGDFVLGIINRNIVWQREKLINRRDAKDRKSCEAYEYAPATVFLCDSAVVYDELDAAVDAALLALTERQRIAFILRHREGYKLKRVAEIMKIGKGGVQAHIKRACKNLQKLLADYR